MSHRTVPGWPSSCTMRTVPFETPFFKLTWGDQRQARVIKAIESLEDFCPKRKDEWVTGFRNGSPVMTVVYTLSGKETTKGERTVPARGWRKWLGKTWQTEKFEHTTVKRELGLTINLWVDADGSVEAGCTYDWGSDSMAFNVYFKDDPAAMTALLAEIYERMSKARE